MRHALAKYETCTGPELWSMFQYVEYADNPETTYATPRQQTNNN